MTHDELRARLLGAMDGSLDPLERDEVERHVSECAACRTEQVELHRMRRAMDRQEEAREGPQKRGWGPLGLAGMSRLLVVVVLVGGGMWYLKRRTAPAAPTPPARVRSLGPGVLAGPTGREIPVPERVPLGAGDAVAVPAGTVAVVQLPDGARLALGGPASGARDGDRGWRAATGRLLAEASGSPLRLPMGPAGTLVLTEGRAAVWTVPEGDGGLTFRAILLEGHAAWEGPGQPSPLAFGETLSVSPYVLEASRKAGPLPGWTGLLAVALLQTAPTALIPLTRLAPE